MGKGDSLLKSGLAAQIGASSRRRQSVKQLVPKNEFE